MNELIALRQVAAAAQDLEETLFKLVQIGETDLVSSDIGAAALCERLNTLHERLAVAKNLGESS